MSMQVKRKLEDPQETEQQPEVKKNKSESESEAENSSEAPTEEYDEEEEMEEEEEEEQEEEEEAEKEENGEEEDEEVEQVLLVVQNRRDYYVDNFIHYVPLSEFADKLNEFIPDEKEGKLIGNIRKARWLCDKVMVNINECVNREDVEGLDHEEVLEKVWKKLRVLFRGKSKPWDCYRVIPSQKICIVAQAVLDLNGLVM